MASLPASNQTTSPGNHQKYRVSFTILTVLYFMWGILTVLNDILIPDFKVVFPLNVFQAMLVMFVFFGTYFIGSFWHFIISAATGDPIAKIGYKNGVVIGLLILASGSAIFWPAASATSCPMFLAGLFAVGLGFAVLQITDNFYGIILGCGKTSLARPNHSQNMLKIANFAAITSGRFIL